MELQRMRKKREKYKIEMMAEKKNIEKSEYWI